MEREKKHLNILFYFYYAMNTINATIASSDANEADP